ncbi:MAG: PPC domain-containing protein, partial [Planctomycetota bacterium]
MTTTNDNRSYLVGTAVDGSPLRDGTSFNVPQGVTVMIEAGTLIKLHRSNLDAGSSSIDINRGGGAMQFLGTPETPVWLRSYFDTTIGSEPPIVGTAEGPGDYGGIVFRADSDLEEQGMFLNYVSHTDIRHGGGKVLIETGEETFSPIQMIDARPTVAFNTIRDSADAAVSANPDSFAESLGRIGPDVVGNFLSNNSFNGLFISIETDPSRPTTKLTVPGRFNDTDIPHILTESLLIDGQPGGQLLDEFGNLISVRSAGRLKIDAGIVLKIDGARIESELGGSALIAEGTPDSPIIFTSLQDDRYGGSGVFDTTGTVNSVGTPGDWGGLYFGQTSQGSIDNAIISFAGGDAAFDGVSDNFNAVEIHQADVRIANTLLTENADGNASGMRGGRGANDASTIYVRGSQPILLNNQLVNNAGAGISINANSLKLGSVPDRGRSTGPLDAYTQFDDNVGPLIRLNAFENNGLNGMLVRSEVLTTEGIWDDTDIVHVVGGEIIVDNYHTNGGLTLKSSGSESLVVKFAGANAGITATGTPLDIVDRVGGAVTVLGAPGFPVVLTSLFDDNVGAGFTPSGLGNTDTGNDGFSDGLPGDWRGLVFDEWSNDRNVAYVLERESPLTSGKDVNFAPSNAQFLGGLATDLKNGDENRRLGFEVNGFISPDDASDVDVYAFEATAGTPIWIDLDRTGSNLDGVIELINSSGTVLARSIRSTDPAFADSVNAQTLTQNPLLGGDYFTENFRDAGMHLVLPGTPGAESRYFIRVRSLPTGEISSLDGNSRGAYQLQVRLRQVDEVPGSLVQYADIRFADKGLDIRGLPSRSLLTGNVGESAANNDTLANSQTLVNLLETDAAALSIAGNLANRNDVDWYSFDVSHVGVQSIPGVNDSNGTVAVVFDMDYADKFNRADTTIAVYDASGQLVFVGRESNIDEDRPEGTDPQIDDLNRGSSGSKDPYIGPIHLLGGQVYSVAVMSNAVTPTPLVQFYSADLAGDDNRFVRLEPINSVQRVVEDHIGNTGYSAGPDGVENKFEATTQSIFNIADADALRNDHIVGATLASVPLFVSTDVGGRVNADDQLYLANAFQGGEYTRPVSPNSWQAGNDDIQDITIRSDGRMFGYLNLKGNGNDNTVGQLVEIDPTDGTILSTQNDRIPGLNPTPNERDIDQDIEDVPGSTQQEHRDTRADEFTNSDDVDALAFERLGDPSNAPSYHVYYSVRESENSSKLYRGRPNGDAEPEADPGGNVNQPDANPAKYGLVGNINLAGTEYAETRFSVSNNGTPAARTDIRVKSTRPGTPGDFTMTIIREPDNTTANIRNVNLAARTFTLNIGGNNGGGPSAQAIVNAINNHQEVRQLVTAVIVGGSANGQGNNGTVANNVGAADYTPGVGTPLAGRVTGLSFDDPVAPERLFGVTSEGEFIQITYDEDLDLNGNAVLLSVIPDVSFSALTQGPQHADGGAYRELFFATGVFNAGTPGAEDEIRLYALDEFGVVQTTYLDAEGNLQDIFQSGMDGLDHVVLRDIPNAAGDVPTGIAFSPLDVNLWHPTTQRATDAGHGIYAAPDGSRTPNEYDIEIEDDRSNGREFTERDGAASFYFGLEDWIAPNQFGDNTEGYLTYAGEENAQFGLTEEIHRDLVSNPDLINTYALAGGVAGSLVSNPFSLAGSVPEDRPTLYVNYFLETENHPGETDVNGADPFRDSARILASVDGGVSWSTLATNNSALSAPNPTANGQAELPGFISHLSDAGLNSGTPRDESHQIVQELFDNTGSWRQVRVDLSSFANQSDVRLRFDFSTSGRIADDGVEEAFGELTSDNRSTTTISNGFEGFYIDDIIVGYAERGEMVTTPGNQQAPAPDASTFVLMSESPTADNTRTSNRDPNQNPEILSGDYQLEVRRVDEYAILADDEILLEGLDTLLGPILAPGLEEPFPGVSFPFDTNDRLTLETATGGVGFDADRNRERQQGVFIVDSNFITESATVGIHVQPGAVDAEGVAHPGATIHFPQLNADQLVPGVVIENNVIVGASGIQFDGDVQAEPNRPVPYGRIINNTLSGRGNGTGIDVTGRAGPTIINNIVHNFGLGIDTDGQSN